MKLTVFLLAITMCVAAQAQRGTVPRESAQQYPVHTEKQQTGVGVRLLTNSEARKALAIELDRCCLVVEVALFPPKDGSIGVSLDDFVLRSKSKGDELADRPSSPDSVAAMLDDVTVTGRPESNNPEEGRSGAHRTTGVGYESTSVKTPNGSANSRGVTLSSGTSVGVGMGGRKTGPAGSDRDRRTIETELRARELPQGETTTPVSGYLYFPLPSKKDKKAERSLEYTMNGEKIVLTLP